MANDKNEQERIVNISVSGWSGSGATSLALILTSLFSYRYLHLGGVFRYLGSKLGHSEEGFNRPKFDDYIEPIIGPTADKYRDYKLLEDDGFIADSDLGTFLIGKHPKVFSIFLKSEFEERVKKVIKDEREDALSVLKERDEINRKFYLDMHNIDVFDEELIDRKFNYVLDNTHVSLDSETRMVIENLRTIAHFKTAFDLKDIDDRVDEEVERFAVLGKNAYKETLLKKKLIVTPKQIITEISQLFPEDLAEYPENIRDIFLGRD